MNPSKIESSSGCPTVGRPGLEYLSSLTPWAGKGGFGLEKMRAACHELGNPQEQYRSVHVAGTNGKGSVSTAISSIFAKAGNRVGMTISPHLHSINERIVIDGLSISDDAMDSAAIKVMAADRKLGLGLSFFEGITACSFVAFAEANVDVAVLEVGLGGRLDATNIITKPLACVIVSIDFDHQDLLGDTLEKIAAEKAGIIKGPGHVTMVGEMPREALDAIESIADRFNSRCVRAGMDFSWNMRNGADGYTFLSDTLGVVSFRPRLAGAHQAHNMSIAIAAARSLGVPEGVCQQGVEACFWPGRLELVDYGRGKVLLDCAHNPAGVHAVCKYLKQNDICGGRVVFGALNTKNWRAMIGELAPFFSEWLILKPESPNGLEPQAIADYLSGIGVSSVRIPSSYEDAVQSLSDREGITVAVGSIYMLGRIRGILCQHNFRLW